MSAEAYVIFHSMPRFMLSPRPMQCRCMLRWNVIIVVVVNFIVLLPHHCVTSDALVQKHAAMHPSMNPW